MVLGTGVDIIEINRIKKAAESQSFLKKVYTENELKLFNGKNNNTLAGNFAAKEAAAKAFGTGFSGFSPSDIEVLRDEKGKPYIVFYNEALRLAKSMGVLKTHTSISHSREYAVASVIFEGGII